MLIAGGLIVVGGVLGLAALTLGDEPSREVTTAAGSSAGVPQRLGATVEFTGDRPGELSTERTGIGARADQYLIEGDEGRILLGPDDAGELVVEQMSWQGLDFFPDADDCAFTPGPTNEELGLAAVRMSCPSIRDVRDTATVTLEGTAALPIDLVVERDLPETGGTLQVSGDRQDTWRTASVSWRPGAPGSGADLVIRGSGFTMRFTGDDELVASGLTTDGVQVDLATDACDVSADRVAALSPGADLVELTISCTGVDLTETETIDVSGVVVAERIRPGS